MARLFTTLALATCVLLASSTTVSALEVKGEKKKGLHHHRIGRSVHPVPSNYVHSLAHRRATASSSSAQLKAAGPGYSKHHGHDRSMGGSVWPLSIYWSTVQVGTPAKTYTVCIDTGSNALFLSGSNCTGCPRSPPATPDAYSPAASSSAKSLGKPFDYHYETCNPMHPLETCSVSGAYYSDYASLAGYGPGLVDVGVIEAEKHFFDFLKVDGIMGMVGGPASGNVFQSLCIQDGLCGEPVFGICLNEGLFSNGTLTIGGADESLADGPMTYVPSPNTTNWHEISLPNITVNGQTISNTGNPISGTNAIIDSGTYNVLIPDAMWSGLQSAVCGGSSNLKDCNAFFEASNQICKTMTPEEVNSYPTIHFNSDNGLVLDLKPTDYLLEGFANGTVCFGLSNGGQFMILGDTIMQNYYVVFGEQQMGWGKVNKQTCGSI